MLALNGVEVFFLPTYRNPGSAASRERLIIFANVVSNFLIILTVSVSICVTHHCKEGHCKRGSVILIVSY